MKVRTIASAVAAGILLSSCAPINFAMAVSADARLNAHAKRIVRLEGNLLGLSDAGKAMATSGNPPVEVTFTFPTERETPTGFVCIVPAHTYAGSIARHFVHPDNVDNFPGELDYLVRAASFKGEGADKQGKATITFDNVPDGKYRIVACSFTRSLRMPVGPSSSSRPTKMVYTHGVYAADMVANGGTKVSVSLERTEDIDKPEASKSSIKLEEEAVAPKRRGWRSGRSKK